MDHRKELRLPTEFAYVLRVEGDVYAAIGACYDYGGEDSINGVSQDDRASALRPTASSSARFGTVRVTVRYENTSSKPDAAPENALVALRMSGPLF